MTLPLADDELHALIWATAEELGWDVVGVSLYDEEGVDGLRWERGDEEYYEIGTWGDSYAIPAAVEDWYAAHLDEALAVRATKQDLS